jgi:drug/metabolite transporter (DMT)-like permease
MRERHRENGVWKAAVARAHGLRARSAARRQEACVSLRLGLGMAVFGSATPVSRIVTSAMPVFIGSFIRVALGALVLAPFAWRYRGDLRRLTGREWALVALIAAVGMFGFSAMMLYGMRRVPGVVGAVVMSTTPAVTTAASMLFLGASATWRKLLAIGLAVGACSCCSSVGASESAT